jgi:protein-S-isoprenylcysteine O-methyltransferase Ste14
MRVCSSALVLVVNLVLVPWEEQTLEAAFGQDYLLYKNRVSRWLGHPND